MNDRFAEAARTALRAGVVVAVLTRAGLRVALGRGTAEDEVHDAVIALGPTAVKLAQVASTRPDLVPESVSCRLEELQESAPRFSFREARAVVERDLGRPLDALFREFPVEPIASASLSQVYFATLADGSPVAVKVQRPEIGPRIQRDIRILRALAKMLTTLSPGLRNMNLKDAVDEFGRWTLRELDFRQEGENADEFRRNFSAWPDVQLPVIHWAHTSKRVLTMERVDGRRAKQAAEAMDDAARLQLVRQLAEVVMKMFVDDGFFHADLHPGNIFFPENGNIVLLDVGMVGRMSRAQAGRFLAYWMAVGRRQRERAFHHLLALALHQDQADLGGYRAEYDRILDAFDGSTVTKKSLARTYFDVVRSGARHGVIFPSEMLLQAKALVTMEALCLLMAPQFRFSEEMRPIVARRLAELSSPAALRDRLWTLVPDLIAIGQVFDIEPSVETTEAEESFRRNALLAVASSWIDAADAWLVAHAHESRTMGDRPELAALLELAGRAMRIAAPATGSGAARRDRAGATGEQRWQAFREGNRMPAPSAQPEHSTRTRGERSLLADGPAVALPLARVALARTEAALREYVVSGAGQCEQTPARRARS